MMTKSTLSISFLLSYACPLGPPSGGPHHVYISNRHQRTVNQAIRNQLLLLLRQLIQCYPLVSNAYPVGICNLSGQYHHPSLIECMCYWLYMFPGFLTFFPLSTLLSHTPFHPQQTGSPWLFSSSHGILYLQAL